MDQYVPFTTVTFSWWPNLDDGERVAQGISIDIVAKMQISIGMQRLIEILPLWRYCNGVCGNIVIYEHIVELLTAR